MDGRHCVRLIVAAVFVLGSVRPERHQFVQCAPIDGELDHGSARLVSAHDIASLKDLSQQPLCLAHRPNRWLPVASPNHLAGMVNEASMGLAGGQFARHFADLTAQFSITADNLINNVGGADTTGAWLVVTFMRK